MSPIGAATNDPLEEIDKNKAENSENPLLEESKKQQQRPKKKNVIYQWVDVNGKTVISDIPHEGAIEIKLPEPQTYTAPKIKTTTESNQQPKEKFILLEKFNSVPPKLKILSPINESWLENNQGNLQVYVSVKPKLKPGQSMVIKLDGKEISRGLLNQVNLQGLDRGNHILLVEVVMTKTQKVIASEQSNFNVRRPTVRR